MKKRLYKITSMILAVMLLLSCFAPMTLAAEKTEAEVGASYTIYFRDSIGWANGGNAYCYMWNSETDVNSSSHGALMTRIGDHLYQYTTSRWYENVRFYGSTYSAQTIELTANYGYIFDNETGIWTEYGTENTLPSEEDDFVEIDSMNVYLRNSAGWSTVYVYMWYHATADKIEDVAIEENNPWPADLMEHVGNNVYKYTAEKKYDRCIFNDNLSQSPDLKPRYGYLYDNLSHTWEQFEFPETTVAPTTVEPTTIEPTEPLTTTIPTEPPVPENVSIFGDITLGLTDNGTGYYTGTVELEKGSYAFKVDVNGTELGLGYTFTDTMMNIAYSSSYKSSTTLNATGGYYTFRYNINTNRLTVSYEPYPTEPTEPPTTEPIYTDPIPTVPDDNKYRPAENVETYRYYFYMPNDWYNEYADTANIYWWEGSGACGRFPGYNAYKSDVANIYYCDVPQDVTSIIWNNGFDGGEDITADCYIKAVQTVIIGSEYYDPGESPLYPNGTNNFDNMIYVLDPNKIKINEYSGKKTYGGEWYYYYGNGEYGVQPTRAEAVANGALYNTEYQPSKGNPAPVKNELTVNATSNLFTSQKATYNRRTRELTVTYYIDAEKNMLNTQWELTYDPTVLTLSADKNTKETVSPEFNENCIVTFNDGKIKFNTYNLSLYDISSEEKVFARVVFDVNDFKSLGVYDTTINLDVQHLTLSSLDDETGISDVSEEVRVVYSSVYDDSYGLINTARVEFDSVEIPEFIGDADGSGDINIHDATLIAKYLVGFAELDEGQLLVSDCDGDGVVTIKDVTCIQVYIAGGVNYGNTGQKYA